MEFVVGDDVMGYIPVGANAFHLLFRGRVVVVHERSVVTTIPGYTIAIDYPVDRDSYRTHGGTLLVPYDSTVWNVVQFLHGKLLKTLDQGRKQQADIERRLAEVGNSE